MSGAPVISGEAAMDSEAAMSGEAAVSGEAAMGSEAAMSGEAAIGWIREVVMDCPEPWALASFWAGLLGGSPVEWYPGWVTIEPPPRPH